MAIQTIYQHRIDCFAMLAMTKGIVALFLVLAVSLTQAANVYQWTDSKGQTHFSDKPRVGATKRHLPSAQTYTPPSVNAQPAWVDERILESQATYQNFSIISPQHDATIRNNQGAVTIALAISPSLAKGHQIAIYLDGERREIGRNVSFTLVNIDRGTHDIVAKIIDDNEKILAETPAVTLHVHRPRINQIPRPLPLRVP